MKSTSFTGHLLEYPKAFCFLLSCLLAYTLFRLGDFSMLVQVLDGKGYLAVFIAGLLFSFGFTSPFGIAIFATVAHDVDPFIASLVGGLGAFLSDLCILQFVRFSLDDEIGKFKTTRFFGYFHSVMHHRYISERMRQYFLWSIAGLVIASPLPDELGVTMISSASDIRKSAFSVLCLVFNTLGILVLLLAARALG